MSALQEAIASSSPISPLSDEPESRVAIPDEIQQLINLIGSRSALPSHLFDAIMEIKNVTQTAARRVAIEAITVGCDKRKLIQALDKFKEASNLACESLILPKMSVTYENEVDRT